MAPHLNQQLREQIVFWQFTEYKTAIQIFELGNYSETTVYNSLQYPLFAPEKSQIHIIDSEAVLVLLIMEDMNYKTVNRGQREKTEATRRIT